MTMIASEDPKWRAFIDEPASYIDTERLAQCMGSAVPLELCTALKANSRLQGRLAEIVKEQCWLPPEVSDAGDETDRAIATSSAGKLEEMVLRSGAIYWAAAIANTILAADVAALQDQVGEELCSFALKHRDLAGPHTTIAPVDSFQDRLVESGWSCLAAWCETLDPAVGARVRLKLPPSDGLDAPVDPEFQETGPVIFKRAAAGVV